MSEASGHRSIFVTGAAGCIGSALARRLSQDGFRVVAFVRDVDRARHLRDLPGVELVAGDLESVERIAAAMRGCQTVFHLAAKVHASDAPASEFARVNVEGSRHVMEAAVANGIANFVFFSSVAVYPEGDELFDEQSAPNPATAYGASKLEAEKLILRRTTETGMKTVVLRLPVVYGPRDRGNVGKLIDAIQRGRFFLIGDGTNLKTMVAVENVVDAALLVASEERARGQVYIVCDERPYTQREIATTIAVAAGRPGNFTRLPRSLAMLLGHSADLLGRLAGVALPISADRVRKLAGTTRYSAAKIRRELGFVPRIAFADAALLTPICPDPSACSATCDG